MARAWRRLDALFDQLPKAQWPVGGVRPFALPGATGWHFSKLASFLILIFVVGSLIHLQGDLRWFVYREHVTISGVTYLQVNDLYQASGVDSWNTFWLSPRQIRDRLLALPQVQAASVEVRLPNQVSIYVQEQQPVALWVTGDETLWLMPDGLALPMHDQRYAALPQIVDPQRDAQAMAITSQPAMERAILSAALALLKKRPDIEQLRFNRDYGLNFNLPNTLTWVYWGDGHDLESKFAHFDAALALIQSGQAKPQVIDVRYERPYIR
jgi:cell division septal protein FtsQ